MKEIYRAVTSSMNVAKIRRADSSVELLSDESVLFLHCGHYLLF
jgi:hypothetical protein